MRSVLHRRRFKWTRPHTEFGFGYRLHLDAHSYELRVTQADSPRKLGRGKQRMSGTEDAGAFGCVASPHFEKVTFP